ncbi:MAG: hypothetical protein ABJN04_15595 [Hyphomicrobiales bacterium]
MARYKKRKAKTLPIDDMLEDMDPYKWEMVPLKDHKCDINAKAIVTSLTELDEEGGGAKLANYINTLLISARYVHPLFLDFVGSQIYAPYEYSFNGAPVRGISIKQRRAVRETYALLIRFKRAGESGQNGKVKQYISERFGITVSNLEKLLKTCKPMIELELNNKIGKFFSEIHKRTF